MLKTSLDGAISAARTLAHVDELARNLWQAYGAGTISDAEAENLGARIEDRRREIRPVDRTAIRAPSVPRSAASCFPLKPRRAVSPDRVASMARRRRLAASGPMPPALASHYTTGQMAVFRIVADEVRQHGACSRTLGEIAARAGVGITTARDAIRAGAFDGILIIEERRRRGAPNLPNVVRVTNREWSNWIKRSGRGGSSFSGATYSKSSIPPKPKASTCENVNRQAHDLRFRPAGSDRSG
jgi:hypothetical protein